MRSLDYLSCKIALPLLTTKLTKIQRMCDETDKKLNNIDPARRSFLKRQIPTTAQPALYLFLLLFILPSAINLNNFVVIAQSNQQQQQYSSNNYNRQRNQQQQQQQQQQDSSMPQAGTGPSILLEYAGDKYLEPTGAQFHLTCLSSAPLKEWLRNDVSLYAAPPDMLTTLRQRNVWTDMTRNKDYSIRVERNINNHQAPPYRSTLTSGTRLDSAHFGGNYTCVTGDRSGNIAQHMTHHVNVLNQWNAVEAEALRYVSDTEESPLPSENTATLANGDVVMVLDTRPGRSDHDIELKCDCQLTPCPGNITWTHFDRHLLRGEWLEAYEFQRQRSESRLVNSSNKWDNYMPNIHAGSNFEYNAKLANRGVVVEDENMVRVIQKQNGVSKLIIPVFHFDDLGIYKCQLDTSDVSRDIRSITRAITIYMPPVVNIDIPKTVYDGDENVTISCEATGYPKPSLRWHVYDAKDDSLLDPRPIDEVLPNVTVSDTDRGWAYPQSSEPWVTSTIFIPKAADSHSRRLLCVAENSIPLIRDHQAYEPQAQVRNVTRTLRVKNPNSYIIPAAVIVGELISVVLCIWCCGRCDSDETQARKALYAAAPVAGRPPPMVASSSRAPYAAGGGGGSYTGGETRPLNSNNPGSAAVEPLTGPTHEYIFVPGERGGEVRPATTNDQRFYREPA